MVFVGFEWFWFYLFIYIFNRCLSLPSILNYGRYKRIFFKTNYLFIVSLDRFKWRAFCSVSFSFPRQNLGNWLCFKQFTRSSETIISVDTHLLYNTHLYFIAATILPILNFNDKLSHLKIMLKFHVHLRPLL